ncbi:MULTISPECIES: DMT family transporter [Microbacterium]|uniref:DMT family transporter n=1 Tax=Microbacterium TaxID=33882 RepID=UPI00300F81BB
MMTTTSTARPATARSASVAALTLATVFAGMLGPLQALVNGRLGSELGDGHAAALISFGTGLVLMLVVVFTREKTRRAFLALPGQLVRGELPRWNFFAGLCGAVIVLSEGVTVGFLGVAVFQTSLISGLVISGVLCDRLGIGVRIKQAVTVQRAIGAVLAIAATLLVVSPSWSAPHMIALAIMPFVGGLLAGWQPAGNSEIGRLSGSMLVSITWNFLIGFAALGIVYLIRMAATGAHFALPDTWWMYLGGPLGLLSIALMALLVRGLGLLLLGLASTAGQLIGSILIEVAVPSHGVTLHAVTVIGALVALAAAAIAMIPSRRAVVPEPEPSGRTDA